MSISRVSTDIHVSIPSNHMRLKLLTKEYVLNAFLNHDIAFINRIREFTKAEVCYLESINPIYLLTLVQLDKLGRENVCDECMSKIIDQSIRFEYSKGVLFYLTCKLLKGDDIDDALTKIAKLYPDMFLNLHLHIQLPILSIPDVNMGTINTLRAIRGDGMNITAAQIDEAIKTWVVKRKWKGEVGKALLQHRISLFGDILSLNTMREMNVRVMYLNNIIPNITESGKLTDLLQLNDKEYTARCMAGFEVKKVGLNSIEIIDYDIKENKVISVSSCAVASLLCMFSETAALVQDFEEMLLFCLTNGYIHSACHLLDHHPQRIRSFVEKYHSSLASGGRSPGCAVMYKRSYQLFLTHVDMYLAWSMIKTCDNAVFTKMFFSHHPDAHVDLEDLKNHPTLFNTIPKSEKKRVAKSPGFVEFANACLAKGYSVPARYINSNQIEVLSALKSGELDLVPEKRMVRAVSENVDLLPFIPSQTVAMLLDDGTLQIDRILQMRPEMIEVVRRSGNPFRTAFYQQLETKL